MRSTTTTVSFETYGGSAPENYQRYFVPAIGEPLARDLVAVAGIGAANGSWTSPAAPAWWHG